MFYFALFSTIKQNKVGSDGSLFHSTFVFLRLQEQAVSEQLEPDEKRLQFGILKTNVPKKLPRTKKNSLKQRWPAISTTT